MSRSVGPSAPRCFLENLALLRLKQAWRAALQLDERRYWLALSNKVRTAHPHVGRWGGESGRGGLVGVGVGGGGRGDAVGVGRVKVSVMLLVLGRRGGGRVLWSD